MPQGDMQLVAVAGATGRTGSLVVKELRRRTFSVRALVRSCSRAAWIQDAGAEVTEADIGSVDSLQTAVSGASYIISALGSKKPFSGKENNLVDNMAIRNLAIAGKSVGIKKIVVISSIGVGNSRKSINFIFRLLMGPVLKRKHLSEQFITTCGIDYTIIRPGGLSDKPLSGSLAFGEGGKISGLVSRKDIARVCVDALEKNSMKNRVLEVVDASTVQDALRRYVITL